jgi:hypothetical protein
MGFPPETLIVPDMFLLPGSIAGQAEYRVHGRSIAVGPIPLTGDVPGDWRSGSGAGQAHDRHSGAAASVR